MINITKGNYCSVAFIWIVNTLRYHPQTQKLESTCTAHYYYSKGLFTWTWLTRLVRFPKSRHTSKSFAKFSMCWYKRAGWLGSRYLGFSRSQWSHFTSNSLQTVRCTPECNIDTRVLAGTMSTGGAPSPLAICFDANKFVDLDLSKYLFKIGTQACKKSTSGWRTTLKSSVSYIWWVIFSILSPYYRKHPRPSSTPPKNSGL